MTGTGARGRAADDAVDPIKYSLLSVIVPVFNERTTVGEVIRRIRAVDLPMDVEVVVVDDGSSDGTDKVLAAMGDSSALGSGPSAATWS
jgi:cellulose synthase/poly-beta-1,6-N-acetylglucosamine synthase-like glycosyltransferase